MNSYDLSRRFVDFSFENPSKIKPNHYALYFFSIEHCNRLGWKKEFGLPTTMTMEAIGVRSYNTYSKTFNELVEFGFFDLIERSTNQYSANIIALSNFNKALDKALDKAFIKHGTKQRESTEQSIDSINKPINKQTINKCTEEFTPERFLKWFNDSRTKLLEKPSNVNFLSNESKIHLKILTNKYTGKDFGKALNNICNDKWANESNNIMPKHFLNPEQFTKYLDMELKPLITKKQKINRGWAL